MTFPTKMASILTGATVSQLHGWRKNILVPELGTDPYLYSFRDLVALRTMVKLRTDVSLQAIRKAFNQLQGMDLTEHPSAYELRSDGKTVYLIEGDAATDLVKNPGQRLLLKLDDLFAPFDNFRGERVVDFRRPRPHLHVSEQRLGGWPTVEDTRVPFDVVADLVSTEEIRFDQVEHFYPGVTVDAARDSLSLQQQLQGVGQGAA